MFGRKTKKFFAMLCIAVMIFATLGENAMVVMAAGEANQGFVDTLTEEIVEEPQEPEEFTNSDVEVVEPISEGVSSEESFEDDKSENSSEQLSTIVPEGENVVAKEVSLTENTDYVINNGVLTIKSHVTAIRSSDGFASMSFSKLNFEENSKLTFVDVSAFQDNDFLSEIDFTNCIQLTDIKQDAFRNCNNLSKITFSTSLQSINISAFKDCINLKSVTLTEGLISISSSAFEGCISLEKVVINANNVYCANSSNIFKGCNISEIVFSNNTVVPAGLFNGANFDENFELVIPNYIQEIGENAFKNSLLQYVEFENTQSKPSALASIGKGAFNNCEYLENFILPDSLKVIEDHAFYKCSKITKVVIPNSVTKIGTYSFAECKLLWDISLSSAINSLGAGIFEKCISLNSIEIPSGSFGVGSAMFRGCTNLSDVKIADTVSLVGSYAFSGCSSLQSIVIPDSVIQMDEGVFYGCTDLDNPVISKNIKEIPDKMFYNCTRLTTITYSDVVAGDQNNLVIPDFITLIGDNAFQDCTSIKNISVGSGVITMEDSIFKNCSSILTFELKSKLMVKTGDGIFENCYLNKVVFPEGITQIPANLFSKAHFASSAVVTIPNTVTKIGANAFAGVKNYPNNITAIKFQEGSQLEIIDKHAFQYCTAIVDFQIPESVTEIGEFAFANCFNLKEITIPENVIAIGQQAFATCEVLTTVYYNAIAVQTSNRKIFMDCNIHTILIGDKVTIIPAYLFYEAKFSTNQNSQDAVLVDIYIPSTVLAIGDYSFSNIVNLSGVYFEEGACLMSVGTAAFSSCTSLKTCDLPDTVTSIGNDAFASCESLTSFDLPASLVTLGSGAFKACKIPSFVIPAGVNVIKDYAFAQNTSLKNIIFEGNEIATIDHHAFFECSSLESINIPSGVSAIGDYAFAGCIGLKKVRIPYSVNSIGNFSFKDCVNAKFYVVKGSYADNWLNDHGFGSQTEVIYSINYVLNGGTNDPKNIQGYEFGDEFTFYPATKAGYAFGGWYLEETFSTRVVDLEGRYGDFTLYAKWTQDDYEINYELYGGINHPDNPNSYGIDDEITFLAPTKEGYKFVAWYEDANFSKKITDIKKGSSGDITLYAKWTAIRYTVKFDGNGENAKVSSKSKSVNFGEKYGELPTATREGYEFTGWFTEDNELITADTVLSIPNNHTLYAKWKSAIGADVPTADPVSGTEVFAGTKVMLKTATPGAKIYYTLDGSMPNYSSDIYKDAIVIDKNTVIKAITVKDGYNDSEVAVFTYTVIDESKYWGDITEEDRKLYADATQVPDKIWVAGVKDVVYNGSAVTFDLRVYDNKTLLTEKTDYTVKYSNNKNAATTDAKKAPTVTITSKGNYKGKVVIKFNILPISIESDEFIIDEMYSVADGKNQKPVPTVYYQGEKLKNKKDFTVSYPDSLTGGYINAGTYRIQINGAGNYAGTRFVMFHLQEKTLISKASVTVAKSVLYTGSVQKPEVVVKMSGKVLQEGVDYSLEYENNILVGTGYVVIKGLNSYSGVKRVSFSIKPIALMKKAKISFNKTSVTYTGKPIELNKGADPIIATVMIDGVQLYAGRDFEILSYAKNKDVGTASVVFGGLGGYSGTIKKTFKIVAAGMDTAKVNLFNENGELVPANNEFAFVKGGTKPDMLLTYMGQDLISGKDYSVSYKNNKKIGIASMTIKGKKNFKGTITLSYVIKQQNLAKVDACLQDVVYQKATEIYQIKPVLKDVDGKTLAAGKDYESVFQYVYATNSYVDVKGKKVFRKAGSIIEKNDILPVDTVIKISITGKDNYTGVLVGQYRIVKASISKAKVTVEQQNYSGSGIKPGKEDIVVKVGTTVLSSDDYEIVSYSNNISKGTGTITLRGTGNYGGTITVKFKIVQRNFIMRLLNL